MNDSTNCPINTPWCTEHQEDTDQCVSPPIDIEGAHTSFWILQEMPGLEPVIVLDTAPNGAQLSLSQALDVSDAAHQLRIAVLQNRGVRR
jgi:hypothetical protein